MNFVRRFLFISALVTVCQVSTILAQEQSCDDILESLSFENESPTITLLALLNFLLEDAHLITVDQYEEITLKIAQNSFRRRINLGYKSAHFQYNLLLNAYFDQWRGNPSYLDQSYLVEKMGQKIADFDRRTHQKNQAKRTTQEQFILVEKFSKSVANLKTMDQAISIYKETSDFGFKLMLLDIVFEKISPTIQPHFFSASFDDSTIAKSKYMLQLLLNKAKEKKSAELLVHLAKCVYPLVDSSILHAELERFVFVSQDLGLMTPLQDLSFTFFKNPRSASFGQILAHLIQVAKVNQDTNILLYLTWNCFTHYFHSNKAQLAKELLIAAFEIRSERVIKEFESKVLTQDWTHEGLWTNMQMAIKAPSYQKALELLR